MKLKPRCPNGFMITPFYPRYKLMIEDTCRFFNEHLFSKIEGNYYVSGGSVKDVFVLGRPCNDIDVYFLDDETRNNFIDKIKELGYNQTHDSDKATLFERPMLLGSPIDEIYSIHVVKKLHTSYKEIYKHFDFECCCAVVGRDNLFECSPLFFKSIHDKEIIIHRDEHNNFCGNIESLSSRVRKYLKKGFKLKSMELHAVLTLLKHPDDSGEIGDY